jgi:hypothetical protein
MVVRFIQKTNLVKGYPQIPVATEDIPKTAIIMQFGLFEYLFTPFGMSNAAQMFQRMMDRMVNNLVLFAYMDDSRGSPPSDSLGSIFFRLGCQ